MSKVLKIQIKFDIFAKNFTATMPAFYGVFTMSALLPRERGELDPCDFLFIGEIVVDPPPMFDHF
jgi:hypothetical protein